MRVIGLSFGPQFTSICVLDECGEVLEEGILRTSEAGFRQRFACAAPCVIAAGPVAGAARWVRLLADLGHTVMLGGTVDRRLRPALAPLAARAAASRTGSRRAVAFQRPSERAGALTFLLRLAPGTDHIESAWYFAGPVTTETPGDFAEVRTAPAEPAYEYARHVHELAETGLRFPAPHSGSAAA